MKRPSAFSLVELIVVMVIIGMLAGLVAVRTRSFLVAGKQSKVKAELATITTAIDSFYADQGRYPTNDEGIEILIEPTDAFPEGFLKKVPKDPWDRPYEYVSPGSNSAYEVICLGGDGKEGGEGEDLDMTTETLNE